ncbi:MAG: hypothetical protein I8H92_01750 [Moraxellaceae bacterium]|nr:hypothetical protein [Moraxellaceae bacterium]
MSILKSWKKPSDLLPKLTKPAMVIISALLVSSLATCNASPSYAIASHYQPSNNDSFILVDMVAVRVNNRITTPHCVVGLGRLFITRRTTASLCGFFVRAIQSCPRYDGLDGDTFGCAGVVCASRPTPSSLSPSLAAWVMDLQSNTREVNHD